MSNSDPWGSFNFFPTNKKSFNPFGEEPQYNNDSDFALVPGEQIKVVGQKSSNDETTTNVNLSIKNPTKESPLSPIVKSNSPYSPIPQLGAPTPLFSPSSSTGNPSTNTSVNISYQSPFSKTPINQSIDNESVISITTIDSPFMKDDLPAPLPVSPLFPPTNSSVSSPINPNNVSSSSTNSPRTPLYENDSFGSPLSPINSPSVRTLGTPSPISNKSNVPKVDLIAQSTTSSSKSDPFSLSLVQSPASTDSSSSTISNIENDPFLKNAQKKNPFAVVPYQSSPNSSLNPFEVDHSDMPFEDDDEDKKAEKVKSFGIVVPKTTNQGRTLFSISPPKDGGKSGNPSHLASVVAVLPSGMHHTVTKVARKVHPKRVSTMGLRPEDEDYYSDEDEYVSPSSSPSKSNPISPSVISPSGPISPGVNSSTGSNSSTGVSTVISSNPFSQREQLLSNPFSPTSPFTSIWAEDPIFSVGESENEDEDEKIRQSKRLHLLKDLWENEKEFVGDMEVIVNMYLLPLRDSLKNRRQIIDEKDIPKLFSNSEQLLSVNTEIAIQLDIILEKGFQKEQVQTVLKGVAQIFIKNKNNLKAYAEYCVSNPSAIEFYNQIVKRKEFAQYEELNMKSCNGVKLEKYIVKPVTRIPKYMWFIKELIKLTKQDEEASETLLKAYDVLKLVTQHINEVKNQKENTSKLQEIESCLHGYKNKINVSGRILIREGILQKVEKENKGEPRKFYLFSDMLMWVEEKRDSKFQFKDSIPIYQILVKDVPDLKYAFQIKRLDKKKVFAIHCKSEPEKNLWLADLKKIIDEVTIKQDKTAQMAKQLQMQEWNSK